MVSETTPTRTVLSRHNLHRTYQGAVAKLADPAVPLRPTARRVLRALRDDGPQRVDQLAARLSTSGRRPIRPTTVAGALAELHAAGLAAGRPHRRRRSCGRAGSWSWQALTSSNSSPRSSSTYQQGFQYCPVASSTTWVMPSAVSQSASASRLEVNVG
jgi:hypothetical protein